MTRGMITMSSSATEVMDYAALAKAAARALDQMQAAQKARQSLEPDSFGAGATNVAPDERRTAENSAVPAANAAPEKQSEENSAFAKRKGHTRSIFQWLDDVAADPNLTASAFKVAYAITQHLNKDSGEAFPSIDRIASKIAMSVGTVVAGIRQLEKAGWLEKESGSLGRGHSHRYRIRQKTSAR